MADYSRAHTDARPDSQWQPTHEQPYNPYAPPGAQEYMTPGSGSPNAPHSYPPSSVYMDAQDGTFSPPRMYASMHDNSSFQSRPSMQEERGLLPGAAPYAAYTPSSSNPSSTVGGYKDEPSAGYGAAPPAVFSPPARKKRRWIFWLIALIILAGVGLGLGLYYGGVFNSKNAQANSSGSNSGGSGTNSTGDGSGDGGSSDTPDPKPVVLLAGGDGSEVTMDDGNKFIYNNSFGGIWAYDEANPFSGPAGQPNSWTPPVNESWRWGTDRQYGVNLGGWLVLEPFISPAMFQPYYPNAVDEWTLSEFLRADTTANGGINKIEEHYKTFITEQDFANIAAAGLTWIRLPVPFWAISKLPDEPFLERVSWDYFMKAIIWARKYGLRINLDLHTCPGSQNGWNHSGRVGMPFHWLMGTMGTANIQRTLDIIRVYAEFINRPEISPIVQMFGIVNEPQGNTLGIPILKSFYYHAYQTIREVTGLGKGPVISVHTGFADNSWAGWLPRSDRIALDKHPYLIFGSRQSNDPPVMFARTPCTEWARFHYGMSNTFGLNSAGEWSAAINDCGWALNEVGVPADFDLQFGEGSCDTWERWETWDADRKSGLQTFVEASMDSFNGNYFFWTWKIGPSIQHEGRIVTPGWSYSLGWENGWIPKDPRTAMGTCEKLGYTPVPFDGVYEPWMVNGQGAVIAPTTTESYPWPPPTFTDVGDPLAIAQYTPTGPLPTLPVPTALGGSFTPEMGGQGMHVAIAGCTYPDPTAAPSPLPATCRMAA